MVTLLTVTNPKHLSAYHFLWSHWVQMSSNKKFYSRYANPHVFSTDTPVQRQHFTKLYCPLSGENELLLSQVNYHDLMLKL